MKANRGQFCYAQPGPPNRLRAYRAFCGKRQFDLAQALGCSAALISKIERGILRPRCETAELLAMALGFDPVQVFPELGLDSQSHRVEEPVSTGAAL
jgi:transcriptional regulator with XRE-family HTH domain